LDVLVGEFSCLAMPIVAANPPQIAK